MGRMLRAFLRLCALAMAVLAGWCRLAGVRRRRSAQPETVVDVLHQFSDQADVIFAGQVLAVRRPGTGVVEVEFRVDEAIRGCAAGTPYVLREWAGLWAGGNQRYRVGQRSVDAAACAERGGDELAGGRDGWSDSDSAGECGDAMAMPVTPRSRRMWICAGLGARVPRAVVVSQRAVAAASGFGLRMRGGRSWRCVGQC